MTKIIPIDVSIKDIRIVFSITKGNISLKVLFKEARVNIAPIPGEHDNSYRMATLARNEELLAQSYLDIFSMTEPLLQLITYYTQRGWEVKDLSY